MIIEKYKYETKQYKACFDNVITYMNKVERKKKLDVTEDFWWLNTFGTFFSAIKIQVTLVHTPQSFIVAASASVDRLFIYFQKNAFLVFLS